MPILLV